MIQVRLMGCKETEGATVDIKVTRPDNKQLPTLEVSKAFVSFELNKVFFRRESNITESGNIEIGSIDADIILVEANDNIKVDRIFKDDIL